MAYLATDDYTLRIGVSHLTEILQQAIEQTGLTVDQVRANAESWARAMITGYLISQYDIAGEFAIAAPAVRNFQIMQAVIDLALYTLHKTINPRDVPDHIEKAYGNTMQWLGDARDKKIVVALNPPLDKALQAGATKDVHFPQTFLDSQQKFVSKPYQDKRLFDTELPNLVGP